MALLNYVAMKALKVELLDKNNKGTGRYELRAPGKPVPEANFWPNPGLWVKRRYISEEKGTPYEKIPRNAPNPPRAVTSADFKARAKRQELKENGELPPSTDFEPAGPGNIGPGEGAPAVDDTPAIEAQAVEASTPESDSSDLLEHSKKELLKMAKKMKVEVSDRANKETIVSAILAAKL